MSATRLLIVGCVAALAGCSTKSSQGPTATSSASKPDPWPAVAATIRRQPDPGGVRQAFAMLASDLPESTGAEAPKAMPDDTVRAIGELLSLSAEERQQIAAGHYSNLDTAHVVECLILRDAVRSFDFGNLPDERKLRLAFDWVCRQVYLRQAYVLTSSGPTLSPPLPPQYALYRGYGTGMDRAYLFLALARQMGLDGGFVGPPEREAAPSVALENDKPTKGPFWAVGVRLADGTVRLFDPWRGEAFPGPDGRVGTLAQVLAGSPALKKWSDDAVRPWDVPAAELARATLYAALPYPAVTSRMKLLESKLANDVGVKLYRDPAELRAALGDKAKIWAPPATTDRFCLTRALPSFLPVEDGGTDRPVTGELRLYDQVMKLSQIPIDQFDPPTEVTHNEVRSALKALFLKRFSELVVESNPREKIGRGQFNDAIRSLVDRERQIGSARDRSRNLALPDDAIRKWSERANQLYEKLSLARLPQNQAGLPEAQSAIEEFWERGSQAVQLVEGRSMLPICAAEVGYLLALCKHEQAERASIRILRLDASDPARAAAVADAKDAWVVAKDSWDRAFAAADAVAKPIPERVVQARRLAARAARCVADPVAE
jgi:hypothetical protein